VIPIFASLPLCVFPPCLFASLRLSRTISYDRRILLLVVATAGPAVLAVLLLLVVGDFSAKVVWTLLPVVVVVTLVAAYAVRERVVTSLQTLANLLSALREGDYSIRARIGRGDDTLGEVMREVNAFADMLREQRMRALEATALLRRVMSEIDVAVFAFDEREQLRMANAAGERLLGRSAEQLHGRGASEIGLGEALHRDETAPFEHAFPGRNGRWGIRRTTFREHGLPHHLLVLLDLSQPLREQELVAWQRIVRVLGHELNNSLAPISSIAGSLDTLVAREPLPEDWRDDVQRGLRVIASRSASLTRFLDAYARLAKLPQPRFAPLDIGAIIERVARLETRVPVVVDTGPPLTISADADQLEQLLINLVRNAADVSVDERSSVTIAWRLRGGELEITITDRGPGIANPSNLFVPFFTTKPEGSGIGLVLSRQIAEAHGGSLVLENGASGGAVARLLLPAQPHPPPPPRVSGRGSEGQS
jgi:two-component system nitrogen regulation sensor histidine kinase NtrY